MKFTLRNLVQLPSPATAIFVDLSGDFAAISGDEFNADVSFPLSIFIFLGLISFTLFKISKNKFNKLIMDSISVKDFRSKK
jgi:hypothetical protein